MFYQKIPVSTDGNDKAALLELYLLDTPEDKIKIKKRPMIIICPGGSYEKVSYREGEPLAVHFLSQGYHACILRYSVAPVTFPAQFLELARTVKMLREHAEEWKIDAEHIIVQGSSAGGHLAAGYGVFWRQEWIRERVHALPEELRPGGIMLSYPVITTDAEYTHMRSVENLLGDKKEEYAAQMSLEKQSLADMPPCFLWHTCEDEAVPVENSLLFASALVKAAVPVELHIFPKGGHGLSLASKLVEREDGSGVQEECAGWIHLADKWLSGLCK